MRRLGFTLAEILITLGIIGVVAALTAPSLVQNAGNAKVGPTLQKAISTLEIANQQLLTDKEASTIGSALGVDFSTRVNNTACDISDAYLEEIVKYISGSSYNESSWTLQTYDGKQKVEYSAPILTFNNVDVVFTSGVIESNSAYVYKPKGSFKGPFYWLTCIDINGNKTKPNTIGKDIFYFVFDNSGKFIPYGGKTYAWLAGKSIPLYDDASSNSRCNKQAVEHQGESCAGSIFDNNLKVVYK